MTLIDADECSCWACKHAQNTKGTCDTGIFGCDHYERFEKCSNLKREVFCGGPTVINPDSFFPGAEDPSGKVAAHRALCAELNKTYARKNHDYGDSFKQTFDEEGLAMARIRLSDKLNRFKALSRDMDAQEVPDESIRDTLMDLANYALMTVLELDVSKSG